MLSFPRCSSRKSEGVKGQGSEVWGERHPGSVQRQGLGCHKTLSTCQARGPLESFWEQSGLSSQEDGEPHCLPCPPPHPGLTWQAFSGLLGQDSPDCRSLCPQPECPPPANCRGCRDAGGTNHREVGGSSPALWKAPKRNLHMMRLASTLVSQP